MRVLLVEDNPNLAQSLNDALSAARFAVDHMADGEAADHVLRTQDYALVILDLGLPKLDGLEVLRRLRDELGVNLRAVDASERFLQKLKDVTIDRETERN